MALEKQVKEYLAYWVQLGKKIVLHNGQETIFPYPVIEGDHYTSQFEQCWQRLIANDSGDCYLEGTTETIQQLLTSEWELLPCARCQMPVPLINLGRQSIDCPCFDLNTWPNLELPLPHAPIDNHQHLAHIRQRLLKKSPLETQINHLSEVFENSPSFPVQKASQPKTINSLTGESDVLAPHN